MAIPCSIKDREYKKFTENSDGNTAVRVVVTNPSPADDPPPTNLLLDGGLTDTVEEGLPSGSLVGTLSVTASNAVIYTIEQDLTGSFQISGAELQTAVVLDSNITPILNVTVRATDTVSGKFTTENFSVTVEPTGGFQNVKSFEFRGDGFINVPDNAYAGDVPTSWWAWIKFDQDATNTMDIFNSRNGTSGGDSGVSLSILPSSDLNDIQFTARRSNGNRKDYRYNFPVGFNFNLWHLVGFSIKNNLIELWIDGVIQVVDTTIIDQNTSNLDPNGVNTYLGANADGTGNYLTGKMSGIAYSVKSGGITPSQWILLYNGGVQPNLEDVLAPTDWRNEYRATASGADIGDPIISVDDQKGSIDAVALNVFASGDVPIPYTNTLSTQFDGATNYFLGSGTDNIDFTLAKTFIFWIKRENIMGTDTLFGNRISVSADNGFSFYFDTNAANRFYWEMESTSGADQRARWNLGASTLNNWAHVAVTMSANLGGFDVNNVECYVNGTVLTRTNQDNDILVVPTLSNSLAIGAETDGGGKVDAIVNEIAIIDRELSAIEVQEAYNLGLPVDLKTRSFGADVVQRWRMGNNNGLGSVMTDDIGGQSMVMVNYNANFFVSDTPP